MSLSSGSRNALSEAASWFFAGCCLVVGAVYFQEIRSVLGEAIGLGAPGEVAGQSAAQSPDDRRQGGVVELKASANGHFFTSVDINGRSIEVMVDTGASFVGLTYEDAERAGIYLKPGDFKYKVNTANGVGRIAIVNLERVDLGDIRVRNVRAAVSEPGRLGTTLLGMSFLGQLTRTEIRQGTLILEQ